MPSSMPDETTNKKRRNLMLSVSAILISAFLKLPVPTAIVSAMNIPEPGSTAWKIWAVALAILAYQIWRFLTDSDTTISWNMAKSAYHRYKGVALAKLLHRRLKSAVKGRKQWLDKLKWDSHSVKPGQTLQYAGFLFSYQDDTGALVNAVESPRDEGRIRVAFTARYEPSCDEVGAMGTLDFKLGVISRWLYRASALRASFIRSEAMQDCTIPVLLALPAIIVCLKGIHSHWQ